MSAKLLVLLCLFGSWGQAQEPLRVPLWGVAFDGGSTALRPILGMPGAAVLGDPIDVGFSIDSAAVAGAYVLAIRHDSGQPALVRMGPGATAVASLDAAAPAPDRVALSPRGASAALYYQAAGDMRIFTGLPDAPVLARHIQLPDSATQVAQLALSDDGQYVLAAAAGALWLFGPDGQPAAIPLASAPAALAFRPGAHDAVAGCASHEVWLLSGVDGDPAYQSLAGPDDISSDIAAVRFSSDGARVLVANPGNNSIVVLTPGTPPLSLSCACTVTGLTPVNGSAGFLVNDARETPLWVVDAAGAAPRLLFVPRGAAPQEDAQ